MRHAVEIQTRWEKIKHYVLLVVTSILVLQAACPIETIAFRAPTDLSEAEWRCILHPKEIAMILAYLSASDKRNFGEPHTICSEKASWGRNMGNEVMRNFWPCIMAFLLFLGSELCCIDLVHISSLVSFLHNPLVGPSCKPSGRGFCSPLLSFFVIYGMALVLYGG